MMPGGAPEEDSISLLELLAVLGREKWLFLGLPTLAVVVAVAVSLWLTPSYTAKAVFVLPRTVSASASSVLAEQLGGAAGAAGGLGLAGLAASPGAMYAAMMESKTIRLSLAQQFHLKQRYAKTSTDFREDDLLKVMNNQIKVTEDKKSGFIAVEVTDEVPQFAADLANAHLEEMRRLLNEMSAAEAERRRDFFEQQIQAAEHRPQRDPAVQTALMEYLIRQHESALLDEAHKAQVLHVVDRATAPDRRSFPKRAMIVLIAGFAGLFLGALLAFVRHGVRSSRDDPAARAAWRGLYQAWGLKQK